MCPPGPRSSTFAVGNAGFAPCIGAALAPPASATAAKAARSLRLFIVVFLSVGASPFLRLHPVRNTHPLFLTTQFRHLVLVDGIVRFVAIVAPPDSEACARHARPTRSLRAPHQHDFDARAFTRALYAGSQNHAGPANVLSGASRLSGLCASLRPSFGAATTLRLKTKMQAAKTPTVSPRLAPSGAGARRVFLRSICARRCSIDSLNLVRDKTASRKCRAANWESRHLGGVTKLQRFHRGSFAATQISPRFYRSVMSGFWYNVHVPRERGYGAKGRNPMHRKTICAAKRSPLKCRKFQDRRHLAEEAQRRLPLFVFLSGYSYSLSGT